MGILIDDERMQMKKLLIGLILMVVGESTSLAQTDFYTNVTNLWYQGYKSNVLEIAEQRLSVNTNDIAGLILKVNYHIAFCERAAYSNAFLRVIQVGDTVMTTNFVKEWQENRSRERIIWILNDFTRIF